MRFSRSLRENSDFLQMCLVTVTIRCLFLVWRAFFPPILRPRTPWPAETCRVKSLSYTRPPIRQAKDFSVHLDSGVSLAQWSRKLPAISIWYVLVSITRQLGGVYMMWCMYGNVLLQPAMRDFCFSRLRHAMVSQVFYTKNYYSRLNPVNLAILLGYHRSSQTADRSISYYDGG